MRIVARPSYAFACLLAFGVAVMFGGANALAQSDIGVILMHGKQSPPNAVADLAAQLRSKGMKVTAPSMPWARGQWESIAVTVETVHAQIDGMAAQLRAQGARRIVVGGHSLGANVALSYAAARGNAAGVILIGPGHAPGFFYQRFPEIRAAVDRAGAMKQAGQGAQPFSGPDNNQGQNFTISTTVDVYLSWMSPRGFANMPAQAPRLAPHIPVLMVIGSQDPAFATARSTIYQPAARHPHSKYVAIQGGDHRSVLGTAGNYAAEWLQGLPVGAAPARGSPTGVQGVSQTCQRFEGTWTSRGPSGTLVLVRMGATWAIGGTGSPGLSADPKPLQSVQRTGNQVEFASPSGAQFRLEEAGRKLTGQLTSATGGTARVDMSCVR